MKSLIIKSVLFLFIFLSFSLTKAEDWSKVRKEIEKANDQIAKAMVADDIKTIASFYTQDAISLPDYKPAINGLDNIVADYKKDSENEFKYLSVDFRTTDLLGSGDIAVETGEWDVSFILPGNTEKMNNQGKYITVWHKQPDGSWKVKVDTWNTNSFPASGNETSAKSSDIENNKSAVEKFFTSFGKPEHSTYADSYFHKDHKMHFPLFPQPLNASEHKKLDEGFLTGFPDAKVVIEDLFAADNEVVLRGKFTGTQTGVFNKIPPTGKMVDQPFTAIVKFKDGQNIEEWVEMDTKIMMTQLGVMPQSPEKTEQVNDISIQEKNKAIVTRFNKEFIEGGDMKAFNEIISKDFINQTAPPGVPKGPEGVLYFFNQMLRPAFPDLKVVIHDQVASGDEVTTRKSFYGTQKKDFMGIPASNKQVVFDVIDIIKLHDGKFVEHWSVLDWQNVIAQISSK